MPASTPPLPLPLPLPSLPKPQPPPPLARQAPAATVPRASVAAAAAAAATTATTASTARAVTTTTATAATTAAAARALLAAAAASAAAGAAPLAEPPAPVTSPRAKKPYQLKYRSGVYAILRALLEHEIRMFVCLYWGNICLLCYVAAFYTIIKFAELLLLLFFMF